VIDQQLRPFTLDPDLNNTAAVRDFNDFALEHAHTLSTVEQLGNLK